MSDEEIIKKRLLIDGDGTGDDRRLNLLLRTFLKWTISKNDTPETNQVMYDRLLAQLEQCKFAAAKTEYTSRMIDQEMKNYAKLSETIEKSIELAKTEIEEKKRELVVAKQIRKNKMQYDMLAKVIKEQPDRKETAKQIEILQKELAELTEKNIKLERKFEKRRNDFSVLMYAIHELEAQLEEDSSSTGSKSDDEDVDDAILNMSDDDNGPSTSKQALKRRASAVKKESEEMEVVELHTPTIPIDEDTILELSIDKDDNDVKILESAVQ